jgi:hypothetical protein
MGTIRPGNFDNFLHLNDTIPSRANRLNCYTTPDQIGCSHTLSRRIFATFLEWW